MQTREAKSETGEIMRVRTWKTRDGEVIPLTQMTTSHLNNTVQFLRRRIANLLVAEEDMQAIFGFFDSLHEQPPSSVFEIYLESKRELDEARTRHLKHIKWMRWELKRRNKLPSYV